MVQLFVAGRLERVNVTTLWVDAGHNVLDHAILAGGIHGLKDDQDGPAILGVEFLLQVVEDAFAGFEYLLSVLLALDASGAGGVPILQAKFLSLSDAERFRKVRGQFDEFVMIHDSGSVVQSGCLEQRTKSPAERGEMVTNEEKRLVREVKRTVQAKHVHGVIRTNGNLDAGNGPTEFDPCGAVQDAVCGV